MDRRGFLKNSIGALLFAGLKSNPVLSQVIDTLTPQSPKVLLYLIQNVKGEWKIKASKWVDLPKTKLQPSKVIQSTFKPLEIVSINQVIQKRKELWKQYNCSGKMGHLLNMGLPFDDDMRKEYIDIGKKHKGKIVTELTLKKMSDVQKGKKHSDKTKEICRQKSIGLNVGRKRTEEEKIKIAEKAKGRKASEETKRKMSEKRKGKPISQLTRQKSKEATIKPVLFYSLPEMNLICEFESATEASRQLKISRSGIDKILRNVIKNPRKYTFKYKDSV